jgi:N-acyl-D-aspartate/D-glutamate deacylase
VLQILPDVPFALDDVFELAKDFRRPIIFSELLTRPDGEHWRRLERLDDAKAAGASDIYGLMAVRPLVFQFHLRDPFPFNSLPEFAELLGLPDAERVRRYADPAWRRRVAPLLRGGKLRWDHTIIDETARADVRGRTVAEIAAELGVEPLDVVLDVGLSDDLATRFRVVLLNDDQASIDRLLRSDGAVVGLSDAGAHASQLCDAGFATELLGTYVRDRGALSLAEGVRKLTSEPAGLLGLEDRGVLKPGAAADVTVFDAETVASGPLRRVWDFPAGADRLVADSPRGVVHVLVNGVPIREDEAPASLPGGRFPGTVLGAAS